MLKKFFFEHFIETFSAAALLFVLGGFTWAFFALHAVGDGQPLILHFNDVNGVTNFGGMGNIAFMASFGSLVILMNFAIAREFESRRNFFGRFLAVMTLVFAVLLFIAFAAIINANV